MFNRCLSQPNRPQHSPMKKVALGLRQANTDVMLSGLSQSLSASDSETRPFKIDNFVPRGVKSAKWQLIHLHTMSRTRHDACKYVSSALVHLPFCLPASRRWFLELLARRSKSDVLFWNLGWLAHLECPTLELMRGCAYPRL